MQGYRHCFLISCQFFMPNFSLLSSLFASIATFALEGILTKNILLKTAEEITAAVENPIPITSQRIACDLTFKSINTKIVR